MTERQPRRASQPDQPDRLVGVDDREETSPLGRGANPGPSRDAPPVPNAQGIAGPRGMAVPGERSGASGVVDRENEDVKPSARHDAR